MAETRTKASPTTLGDVLFARIKARVPEQEWVTLVHSIAAGDQIALHALYERANRLVFTLALRITANQETAEEVTLDVFHDVWRRASSYDAANGTVIGWIMNQARSRAIDRLRYESRQKRNANANASAEPEAEIIPNPHDVLEESAQRESLLTALAILSREERQAIEATFFAGLTQADAAVQLNQPLGTIKSRIRSGLHKLRRVLSNDEPKP